MTFSQKVKDEILGGLKDVMPCCRQACLSALLRGAGSIRIGSGGMGCSISSENKKLLNFAQAIVKASYGLKTEHKAEDVKIKGRVLYSLVIPESRVLNDCGIVSLNENGFVQIDDGIDKYIVEQECCRKAYAASLFAATGSITVSPLKRLNQQAGNRFGYHLEFSLSSEKSATDLIEMLEKAGFRFKIAARKNSFAAYIKDSQQICDILAYFGADKAVFELNNLIIEREIRNNANRQKNCITANIDKSLLAGEKQIAAIDKIRSREGMFDRLSPQLKETAAARVENRFSTLDELAELCGVTKSCVNHRLRKLTEIASKLP